MPNGEMQTFLTPLFDASPEDLDLLLWVLNPADSTDHSSFFVQTYEQAAAIAARYEHWHVYYGVGLRTHQPAPRPRWRGGSADVRGLLLLHGDVDIAHPDAHKNTNLPPDIETAKQIIAAVELPPSFLVFTGYGLQPIWALKEAELLQSTEDRFVAQDVAKRLHSVLAAAAQRMGGYAVDATHDLSRVLRLPGSLNHKIVGSPVACTILETGPLYGGLGDFLDVLPPAKPGASQASLNQAEGKIAGLTLESGEVDPDAFILMNADSKFRQTWEKRRRNLGDGSQSAYDFSIALQALYAGWTPEDTLALMYKFRRKYRNDHRLAYYLFTLKKALATVAAREGEPEAIAEYVSEREAVQTQEDLEQDRATDAEDTTPLFAEMGAFLGLANGSLYTQACEVGQITWTRNGTKRFYNLTIRTPDGEEVVRFSDTQIVEAREVRLRCGPIIQYFDTTPLRTAQPIWTRLLNRLFCVIQEDVQEELVFAERLKSILMVSLRHCAVYTKEESCQQAVDGGHTFVFEEEYYTTFERLRERVREIDPEWTRQDLSTEIRKLDQARNVNKRGTTRRARYWIIPLASFGATSAQSDMQPEMEPKKEETETVH